jgi:hypothetical protein
VIAALAVTCLPEHKLDDACWSATSSGPGQSAAKQTHALHASTHA